MSSNFALGGYFNIRKSKDVKLLPPMGANRVGESGNNNGGWSDIMKTVGVLRIQLCEEGVAIVHFHKLEIAVGIMITQSDDRERLPQKNGSRVLPSASQ